LTYTIPCKNTFLACADEKERMMKVIHVLKKIEQIDDDVRELRKMEKSLQRNKSFTTPIFMTIEKQINNLLGDKVKFLELTIANPPEALAREFDGEPAEAVKPIRKSGKTDKGSKKSAAPKQKEPAVKGKTKSEPVKVKAAPEKDEPFDDIDSIPMLTQDMIDSKFDTMKTSAAKNNPPKEPVKPLLSRDDDRDVKLIDIALSKGTLNKEEIEKEKEKKRVRFFRDNFPGSDY
jgi:hypothetical protein